MTSAISIPTTRISDILFRQRLLKQVQFDQAGLFELQSQLSTGLRIQLPSDDSVAGLRIMGLQRLLERKEQVKTNLASNQSYLSATDVAIESVSDLIADVRAAALGVIDSVATNEQRAAAVLQVEQALNQLIDIGNQKFRNRYLFAGSTTRVQPFDMDARGNVVYHGNEQKLLTYSDVDMLSATNLTGSDVFGAISEPVLGSVDLDPVLTNDTRLADLRGGLGIRPDSIVLSDGTDTSTIDLSGAQTIGDVAALIAAAPPGARTVDVTVTATGLQIELNPLDALATLSIGEVGGGTTAAELGILNEAGVAGNTPIVGSDLDPILRKTTRLSDVLGGGLDQASGLQIVNGGTTYTIDLTAAQTIEDVLNVLNGSDAGVLAEINETATGIDVRSRVSGADFAIGENGGTTASDLGIRSMTSATRLESFNHGHGVADFAGFASATFQSAGTDNDLVFRARKAGADWKGFSVTFTAGAPGSGESVLYDPGAKTIAFTVDTTSPGGTTANDILTLVAGTANIGNDFEIYLEGSDGLPNSGQGIVAAGGPVLTDGGADFTITRTDGVTFEIDIAGAETVADVIALINTHPANLAAGTALVARLATYGNGIELVDTNAGGQALVVTLSELSRAAIDLGLIAEGEETGSAPTIAGQATLLGRDVGPLETESLFTALVRLREALEDNDIVEVERAIDVLDRTSLNVSLARAELGAKQQSLDVVQLRLDVEDTELRSVLSIEHDADLVEVVSNLAARQTALEASLLATARIFQMSLLNYL